MADNPDSVKLADRLAVTGGVLGAASLVLLFLLPPLPIPMACALGSWGCILAIFAGAGDGR